MTAPTTYDAVLADARRLPLPERLRLASALAGEAAGALAGTGAPGLVEDAGWARWERLRAELSARPAGATSMTAQLERDRDARQAALEGRDVHP
jgi:hypothetical protein